MHAPWPPAPNVNDWIILEIWTIIELEEDIVVLINVTKFHKVVIDYWIYRLDIIKNSESSWTKGNKYWKHGVIWTIIELEEDIMVLNNVTKFHKVVIKTVPLREWVSLVWRTDVHTNGQG